MEPDITVDILWDSEEDQPPDLDPEGFLKSLALKLDLDAFECSILVTDDARMQALNAQYRNKDKTTDVLSFPSDLPLGYDGPRHLGDIVISLPQAQRQADELGQSLVRELQFLLLHGVLHLLGYDHETDNGEMLALQTKLKNELTEYF